MKYALANSEPRPNGSDSCNMCILVGRSPRCASTIRIPTTARTRQLMIDMIVSTHAKMTGPAPANASRTKAPACTTLVMTSTSPNVAVR